MSSSLIHPTSSHHHPKDSAVGKMTDPQAGGMMIVVGLMSGTSLDGVDLCCARFDTSNLEDFEILAAETRPYPKRGER